MGIFDKIVTDLGKCDFFSEYKFRKRDSSFLKKTKYGKQSIELDHWRNADNSSMVVYPIYGVRFDVLSKWFEKFSVKSLQDQRDRPSVMFDGGMLSYQNEFYFRLDEKGYKNDFSNLLTHLEKCARYVFDEYSSLEKLYDKTILPILQRKVDLQDVGADWIFIDFALCKLVNPKEYDNLKQIILPHVQYMYEREEPNVLDYYNQLDQILEYLENTDISL